MFFSQNRAVVKGQKPINQNTRALNHQNRENHEIKTTNYMLLKIRHRIALKLYLDSYLLLIGSSLYIAVSCPAGSCPPPASPRELFMYRSELAPRELFMYCSELSLGSCPPPRELFMYYSKLPRRELSPGSFLHIAMSCPQEAASQGTAP